MAAAVLFAGCGDVPPIPIRLMTYNIGTPGGGDARYAYRIADQAYEDCLAAHLRAAAADVVLLQEVLAPPRCAAFHESDPARTCWHAADRESAVRRLLGAGYTIACDARRHVECVAVATSFGTVEGLAPGALGLDAALTPPLPLPSCSYERGECDETRCDEESTVSAVTVATPRGPLRIVHVHPSAPGTSAAGVFWATACRELQLRQVFDGVPGFGDEPLVATGATVVAGDFNLDPVRLIDESTRRLWGRHVGEARRFRDLTPSAPDGTQYGTRRGNLGIAADHVLVAGLAGTCTVHGHAVGVDPATEPLDRDCVGTLSGPKPSARRVDHFAITCDLVWPANG
jgi:endonuclease/exonuclease/phosphatase family metal-dependent hydrolase